MAKELKKSLEDLKAFNKLFSAVKTIADELQDVKNLELAAAVADSKYKKAAKELEDAKQAVEGAKKELAAVNDAKKESETNAALVTKEAQKKKEEILSEAELKRVKITTEVNELQKKADLLANGLSAEVVAIKAQLVESHAELESIKIKIEKTKESLRGFIGK